MAYIGEMQYLTIGNNTYSLPTGGEGGGGIDVEVDPVFSASPAAGITAADITNWNAKVSDDKTWNGVTLSKSSTTVDDNANGYVPYFTTTTSTSAKLIQMVHNQTGSYAAYKLARYNANGYLTSTTPSANDNSTKVATTAYVDGAIPTVPTKTSDLTNDSGFITSYTDTKVTQTVDNTTNSQFSMVFSPSNSTATEELKKTSKLNWSPTSSTLAIADKTVGSSSISKVEINPTGVSLYNSNNYFARIALTSGRTSSGTLYLPNKDGTIALTSDIPTKTSDLTNDGDGTSAFATMADIGSFGGGTVTSVGISNATNGGLSISGSPITSAGTITIGLASAYGDTKNPYGNKTANYVLAGPSSGSAAAPSFRALVAADIPDLSGTYMSASTTIPTITLNETSTTSPIFYAPTTAGTDGYILKSNGSGAPTWVSAELTDTKVTQTAESGESNSRMLLMSDRAPISNVTHDGGAKTSSYLYFQPSTGKLTAGYSDDINKEIVITPTSIRMGSSDSSAVLYSVTLKSPARSSGNTNVDITLPSSQGTLALISDIPSITLNGSNSTSPSFYAPISAGTSGYVLTSNGSGAPTWQEASGGAQIQIVRW